MGVLCVRRGGPEPLVLLIYLASYLPEKRAKVACPEGMWLGGEA